MSIADKDIKSEKKVLHPSSASEAWIRFCDEIKQLGLDETRRYANHSEYNEDEVIRYVSRIVRGALEYQLDGGDRKHPHLFCWDRGMAAAAPTAPSLDNTYYLAVLDPKESYCLSFEVGMFDEINIAVHENMISGRRDKVYGDLTLADLTEKEGRVELILSPDEHSPNWLPLPPEADYLAIRIYYFSWQQQRPPPISLQCLSSAVAPAYLSDGEVSAGLLKTTAWARGYFDMYAPWLDQFLALSPPNVFSVPHAQTGGVGHLQYGGTRFILEPGQALVMEFEIPEGPYWSVQWHQLPWGDSADFMNHVTSLNNYQAQVDGDGRVRIVFSNNDPGIQNWISIAGRREGVIMYRWRESNTEPIPVARIVDSSEVNSILPSDTPEFDTAARRNQLMARRLHLASRY